MLLAKLPNKDYYQASTFSEEQDTFLWEDRRTPLLKIVAPSRNPWDNNWAIKLIKQRDITNNKIPLNLTIRCFYPGRGNFLPVIIVRKEFASQFMICEDNAVHSFGFLLEPLINEPLQVKFWLGYFCVKQGYR